MSPDARSIRCAVTPGLPANTLRHALLDHVIPMALASLGRTVLHAGAVLVRGGVVAFVGDSGSGQSTVTATLARAGYPIVTDDSLLLEETPVGLLAIQSYATLRLWPDAIALTGTPPSRARVVHGSGKRRLGRRSGLDFVSQPTLLKTIYVLDPRSDGHCGVETVSMSEREALFAVMKRTYQLGESSPSHLVDEFDTLCRLVESIPVRRLSFRQGAESLALISQLVERETSKNPFVRMPDLR